MKVHSENKAKHDLRRVCFDTSLMMHGNVLALREGSSLIFPLYKFSVYVSHIFWRLKFAWEMSIKSQNL